MAENKPTFYMMVGVPGSGKTTYAHQIPNATVLSSDDIRVEIGADGGDKKMHKQVFDILHDRVKTMLIAGHDVVYDATNLRYNRRTDFLNEIKNLTGHTICVYFAIPLEQALSQNADRDTPVPEEVIERMNLEMSIPRIEEGWDEIRIVRNLPARNIDRIREMTPQEMAEFLTSESDYAVDHAFAYSGASKQGLIADYVDWLNRPADM